MLTPTRVLIVGGQTLFAETLAQALSRDPETEVVGCCSSVSRALEVLTRCNVRVILHLRESEERGVNLMLALRNQRCESAVVVITSGLNDHLEQEVIQQGVSSIFNTSAGIEALLERILLRSVSRRWMNVLSGRVKRRVLSRTDALPATTAWRRCYWRGSPTRRSEPGWGFPKGL